jgi:hypothetical protein
MNENTIEIHTKKGQHFRLSEQQAHGNTFKIVFRLHGIKAVYNLHSY